MKLKSNEAGEEDNASSTRIERFLKVAVGLRPELIVADNDPEVLLGAHWDRELVDCAGIVEKRLDEKDDHEAEN